MRCALVLVVVASCNRVFGLEGHDLTDSAPGTDGAVTVAGTFVRQVIANDRSPARLPMLTEAGLSGSSLDLELRTGSAVTPVAVASNGGFALATAMPYALAWSIDGDIPIELQSSAPVVALTDLWVGRAERTRVTKPTQLAFDLGSVGSDEYVAVQGTGLWGNPSANEPFGATVFDVDWHQVNDSHSAVALLDAARTIACTRCSITTSWTRRTTTISSSATSPMTSCRPMVRRRR
jgi:hypothetical protein